MINFDNIFNNFNKKKVLIVGDAMIDTYMWGDITRISPEAPVPIVEIKNYESRLGGAANVALNIQSLGAEPILCSIIGNDDKGILFNKLMKNSNITTKGIIKIAGRKTTTKTRVISDNKHQIRIDEEDTHEIENEDKLLKLVSSILNNIDVIILQDYNKGVLTPKIITQIIKVANRKKIPTIVDPKNINFNCYKNCTIFKPNLAEIKSGMNIEFNDDNIEEIKTASTKLRQSLNTQAILLTLSDKGICINSKEEFTYTPAFKRNIIDISGAGDTVLSVAALCLALKIDNNYLSIISSLAGGIVCEEVGVVPINKQKLILETKKHIS